MKSKDQIVKFLLIGNSSVGVQKLLVTYATGTYSYETLPCFTDCTKLITYNDQPYKIQVELSHWTDEYEKIKQLRCQETDVFILCFSLVSLESLEFLQDVCVPELQRFCPNNLCILVGLNSDLLDDENAEKKYSTISKQKIEEVKSIIGARGYVECSPKNNEHVDDIFTLALQVALSEGLAHHRREEHSKCKIY